MVDAVPYVLVSESYSHADTHNELHGLVNDLVTEQRFRQHRACGCAECVTFRMSGGAA